MHIEKLSVTFGQDFTEVDDPENEGKKKSVPVEGTGTTEEIHVARIKWRRRNAIFTALVSEDNPKGVLLDAPQLIQEQFVINIITESVCDAEGKFLITADDLDDLDVWSDIRRTAYFSAIVKYQTPRMESRAKNSSSTSSAAT